MNGYIHNRKLSSIPMRLCAALLTLLLTGLLSPHSTAQAAADVNLRGYVLAGDPLAVYVAHQESEPIDPIVIDPVIDIIGPEPLVSIDQVRLFVGPELIDCQGIVAQKCMLVRQELNTGWRIFYDSIQGFIYESGYDYELLVRKEAIENPPADASSERYVLEAVVNKQTTGLTTLYVGPKLVDCYSLVPQKCMQVRQDPNGAWGILYDSIQGFTYESGYSYKLLVHKEVIDNPPADRSSWYYILDALVSKQQSTDVSIIAPIDDIGVPVPVDSTTLYVGPELADCYGIVPQQCMQVRQDSNSAWQNLYGSIYGFTYERGYDYELLVRKEVVENPPADGSSWHYVLVTVVSKSAAVFPPAEITITKMALPNNKQNFRFTGDLGNFRLDNPAVDDGDRIPGSQSFTVESGEYTVREVVNKKWQLVEITCTVDEGSLNSFSVDLAQQQLTIAIRDAKSMHCVFVSEPIGTIRVQNFDDKNANGKKNGKEVGLSAISYTLYTPTGYPVETKTTNQIGRLNFTTSAGTYLVCEDLPSGRQSRLPGTIDLQIQKPCHAVTVSAGKLVNLFFGSTAAVTASAITGVDITQGIFVEELSTSADEDSGYEETVDGSSDEAVELFSVTLFLPIVQQ